MFFKRLLYFVYYIKKLDFRLFSTYLNYISNEYKRSKILIIYDIFKSSIKHNISILEYFIFHFYKISEEEKKSFAGTGYIYEYQLKMNPKKSRFVLEDKLQFLKAYAPFIRHKFASLKDLKKNPAIADEMLKNTSGKVVLKNSAGQCGNGIEVHSAESLTSQNLVKALEKTGNDFVEEFVVQHDELMRLSPSGLNTLRIITQLNANDEVEIFGARLRITVNSPVDNLAAGNLAAPVELQSGKINGAAVYSNITKKEVTKHPVTGEEINGFQIPFWNESLQLAIDAAKSNTSNRSIGWDIAISQQGPELIEGNHDWCKLLWQLPVKKGLKSVLDKHLAELETKKI